MRLTPGKGRIGRTVLALVTASLCMLFAPLHAQGIGPPDLGIFNYVLIGGWLLFWIAVFVYPIALVVYLVLRLSAASNEEQESVTPSRGYAVLRWSVKIHLALTLAGLLLFALD